MKRLIGILLVLAMVLPLVACGGDAAEEEAKEQEQKAAEVEDLAEEEAEKPNGASESLDKIKEAREEAVLTDFLEPKDVVVLDIAKLLSEQEKDIKKAKELYENKWIELTGKIVSVEHGEYREATRTFMGKTTHFKWGETRYEINGVTIESALIYWLAVNDRFEQADVIVEMDIFLCQNDEQTGYVYYPQYSTVTVVAYCAAIGENNIVFTDGRYEK